MALTKDPDAVLDYTFDWLPWLVDGETIVSHEVEVESGDAVVDSSSQTDSNVVVWLSGGTNNTDVQLGCRVTTSDGRTDDRSITILIREVFADGCEPWPIVGYVAPPDVDAEIVAAATSAAELFLRGVSGGRFGIRSYRQRFQVRSESGGCLAARGSMGSCCAIKLPQQPVQRVLEVKVDGATVPPTQYVMLGANNLTRLAGCWPSSSDCEPGRIEVTYTAGVSLGAGSKYYGMAGAAMGEVVREYVEAMSGRVCKLPSRFVAVTRQGVATQALDPALFLSLGLTGLPLTDNFVRTVNPGGRRRRPRVLSIDGPRRN